MLQPLEERVLFAQTPYLGAPFTINQIIQAENFDNGGQGEAYNDTTAANEFGGYRGEGVDIESTTDAGAGYNVGFIKAGEWLEYTVDVPTTGSYNVSFRLANIRGGGTFHLETGGVNLTGAIAVPNTGNWQTYQTVSKTVSLTAGTQVLRVAFDSNASSGYVANFNWWSVGSSDQAPFGGAPFTLAAGATLEAENFDTGGQGFAYNDLEPANLGNSYRITEGVDIQPTGDAGGGFNVGFAKAGEFLEYTVNAPVSGTYNLGLRLANLHSGGSLHLEVNSVNLTGAVAVPNTGNWQSYQTVNRDVTLNAGVNVVRLVFDQNSSNGFVANVNWIKVNSTPQQAPFLGAPFSVVAGNKLELENFDTGGEGIAYHDNEPANLVPFFRPNEAVEHEPTPDAGGGYNVALVKAGEWLEYTVNTPVGGAFDLGFRVSNIRTGGSFHLEEDGVNVSGPIAVPNTGAWTTYATVNKTVNLSAGTHILRLFFDTNSSVGYVGNFNWMSVALPPV